MGGQSAWCGWYLRGITKIGQSQRSPLPGACTSAVEGRRCIIRRRTSLTDVMGNPHP